LQLGVNGLVVLLGREREREIVFMIAQQFFFIFVVRPTDQSTWEKKKAGREEKLRTMLTMILDVRMGKEEYGLCCRTSFQ
jgi:hypothetical protein